MMDAGIGIAVAGVAISAAAVIMTVIKTKAVTNDSRDSNTFMGQESTKMFGVNPTCLAHEQMLIGQAEFRAEVFKRFDSLTDRIDDLFAAIPK